MVERSMKTEIAYLHGRPNPHPLHDALAASVTQRRFYVDRYFRWHDKEKGPVVNFIGWVVNALVFSFVIRERYVLIDGIHVTTLFFKKISALLFRKRVIMAHLGSHTLYFLNHRKYSRISTALQVRSLLCCDYLLCEGKMSMDLAQNLLKEYKKKPVLIQTFLGVPTNRLAALQRINYHPRSKKIIILASGPNEFREYYKGLDVMISAFDKAYRQDSTLELIIIGEWYPHIIQKYAHLDSFAAILFPGFISSIETVLADAGLCIQVTRGDAFPTSTVEIMTAGIPVILSEWTGTRQIIEKETPEFVVPVDEAALAQKITWFFNLSEPEKLGYSKRVRESARMFTQENAVRFYQKTVTEQILGNEGNVFFVHGRPDAHALHKKYGLVIGGKAIFVDPLMRWHDKEVSSLFRYAYWFINAVYFLYKVPHKGIVLTEGVHITLLLTKKMGRLIGKKIYVTALMDDEFLYFLTQGYYKGASARYNRYFVKQYDHFFCVGEMLYRLCLDVIEEPYRISKGFNGVNNERLNKLLDLAPQLIGNHIIFIGNGPSGWRAYYKGLDLTLQAFNKIADVVEDARLMIIGNWNKDFIMAYIAEHCTKNKSKVDFIGQTNNLGNYLDKATLYLHPGRGEAWGISINEAMAAGIVPVVSNWTGASESVEKIDPALVVPLDVELLSGKVIDFLQQPLAQKQQMGAKAKSVASFYSESAAIEKFKQLFDTWNENK